MHRTIQKHYYTYTYGKGTAVPVEACYRPVEFLEVEAPRFLDSRPMQVVRLSVLSTGCLYPPGNVPGTHFR